MPEERIKGGRGKYKPASNLSKEDIKLILMNKIEEEKSLIIDNDTDDELLRNIDYKGDQFNIVGLFSGCGGMT